MHPRPSSTHLDWSDAARLVPSPPDADLPGLAVVSATHVIADLTLGMGQVVHDYLNQANG